MNICYLVSLVGFKGILSLSGYLFSVTHLLFNFEPPATSKHARVSFYMTHLFPFHPQTKGFVPGHDFAKGRFNKNPYIIHLNTALSMVVTLYFGGKSHMSQMVAK